MTPRQASEVAHLRWCAQTPRQEYVSPLRGVSPFSSEKGIHWRGNPPHVGGGGRLQGPCSIGLLHSPCVSLDTLEQGT